VFFASKDLDESNRVWEAFTADRTDNGCAITCSVQFAMDPLGNTGAVKKFGYAEIDLAQLKDTTAVMAAVQGWKGFFERVLTKDIVATSDRIDSTVELDDAFSLGSNYKQFRTVRTKNWDLPEEHNAHLVEADLWPKQVQYDRAFQLMLAWSGVAGVLGFRTYATDAPDQNDGYCEGDETGLRHVTITGKSSTLADPEDQADMPFPVFTGTASNTITIEQSDGSQYIYTSSASATSQISQNDADRKAACQSYGLLTLYQQFPERAVVVCPPELAVYDETGTTLLTGVNWGDIVAGTSEDITILLRNVGCQTLDLTSVVVTGEGFSLVTGPASMSLAPGESTTVTIRYESELDEEPPQD